MRKRKTEPLERNETSHNGPQQIKRSTTNKRISWQNEIRPKEKRGRAEALLRLIPSPRGFSQYLYRPIRTKSRVKCWHIRSRLYEVLCIFYYHNVCSISLLDVSSQPLLGYSHASTVCGSRAPGPLVRVLQISCVPVLMVNKSRAYLRGEGACRFFGMGDLTGCAFGWYNFHSAWRALTVAATVYQYSETV